MSERAVAGDMLATLRRWWDRVTGAEDARRAAARSLQLADDLHEAVTEVRDTLRARRQTAAQQDWPKLYEDRLKDGVGR